MKKKHNVTLAVAKKADLPVFAKKLQEAFAISIVETFGPWEGEPIPSDKDLWASFGASGAVVYHILLNGQQVGGAVLVIDEDTRHNSLELFFISPEHHSQGLGLAAWKAIEEKYPDTLVWKTVTPYFEQRNIHFYVNKCGFHIVDFFNEHHVDQSMHIPENQDGRPMPGTDAFFRFKKVMQ